MNNKPYVNGAVKATNNRFLNMFNLGAVTRDGGTFNYQVASRNKEVSDLLAVSGKLKADAVAVCGMYDGKMVLIKQYRYPVGGYIYELPAGLVALGEDVVETAKREMFEETGLDLVPTNAECALRPWLSSPGMTDETCAMVFGTCTGEPTNINQEETEDIQVFLVDREEAIRILNEEIVDIRTALAIIMTFNLF